MAGALNPVENTGDPADWDQLNAEIKTFGRHETILRTYETRHEVDYHVVSLCVFQPEGILCIQHVYWAASCTPSLNPHTFSY